MLNKTLFFALCATFAFASTSSTNAQNSQPAVSSDQYQSAGEEVVLVATLLDAAKKETEATAIPALEVTPEPEPKPVAPAAEVTPEPAPVAPAPEITPAPAPIVYSPVPVVISPAPIVHSLPIIHSPLMAQPVCLPGG